MLFILAAAKCSGPSVCGDVSADLCYLLYKHLLCNAKAKTQSVYKQKRRPTHRSNPTVDVNIRRIDVRRPQFYSAEICECCLLAPAKVTRIAC